MYQLSRLVPELLWQAQCTWDPATESTQPTTRRLERSRVGTWVFGIKHLLTGLKWSSAVIAGDFGLPAIFFFLPQVSSTHSNEQFQKSGCITPLPPHSASVKGSASSQTSTELFCLLLPGIGYWGGGVQGNICNCLAATSKWYHSMGHHDCQHGDIATQLNQNRPVRKGKLFCCLNHSNW